MYGDFDDVSIYIGSKVCTRTGKGNDGNKWHSYTCKDGAIGSSIKLAKVRMIHGLDFVGSRYILIKIMELKC